MTGGEILLLGDINIDTVLPVSEFPVPGRDALAPQISVEIGGAVVNSAFVFNNLSQKTTLLGCIGKDVWAEKIKQELAHTTINQGSIRVKPGHSTGLTFVIVTPDGERTMFSHRGANTQLEPQDIDENVFQKAELLHISGYALLESPQKDAAWRAVELAKKHNVPVSLDTGLDPVVRNPDELRRLLPELSICITGPQEIAVLFGDSTLDEAVEKMLLSGIGLVAVKMGEKGCRVFNEKEYVSYPSFSVDSVDTTGAGDSFTAGLIYGWIKGLSLSASAILASALGALATTVYGAGSSLPAKQKLLDFLRSIQNKSTSSQQNSIKEIVAALKEEF
ncbi:MAG: carbohydrate kinase family protein [Anaerolineaceae bacterium]